MFQGFRTRITTYKSIITTQLLHKNILTDGREQSPNIKISQQYENKYYNQRSISDILFPIIYHLSSSFIIILFYIS